MQNELMIRRWLGTAAGALAVFSASDVTAQGLAQRVAGAPDGRVQFNYPARDGACGDGRSYMRLNWGSGSNEYYGNINSNNMPDCVKGPARVILEQAARTVIGIRTFVGPLEKPEGVTDLGAVSAKEASDYLLGLAAKAEGSVSGSAIMPAMIAEGVDNQGALLAIARDQSRARETRRSAITYLSRDGRAPTSVAQPLLAIATDETDNQSVRQQALRTLSRLDGGSGIPELIRLAGDRQGGWTAREALTSLAASGDPRSREFLRTVVRRGELPDEAMATAVRSLGQHYATGADIALIRESWPKLTGQRSQEAALSAITEFGGAENSKWLLALAKDPGISANNQRRALQNAVRAGARVADVITMYNATMDYQMKDAIISALAPNDDRESQDKLLSIAKSDESITARKRAITA
ncbi:MAG: HEAT repeat domain-containing protein, partial [Phycisphaerae bacterium]|nr:HEAT repeat domain-containing protein [Gemmatimonadaceae bacterium]